MKKILAIAVLIGLLAFRIDAVESGNTATEYNTSNLEL